MKVYLVEEGGFDGTYIANVYALKEPAEKEAADYNATQNRAYGDSADVQEHEVIGLWRSMDDPELEQIKRDGTPILIKSDGWYTEVYDDEVMPNVAVCKWDNDPGRGDLACWYVANSCYYFVRAKNPTGWMRIPEDSQ